MYSKGRRNRFEGFANGYVYKISMYKKNSISATITAEMIVVVVVAAPILQLLSS